MSIIINFQPRHSKAFKELNEHWIKTYFELEEADRIVLEDPESYILQKGGSIFVALEQEEVIGVCALLRREDPVYPLELAKMAVAKSARGKGIGYQLGQAVIAKAKDLNEDWLYLESNSILKPAIALYQKLGFEQITGKTTPYQRCNIQMHLKL